MKSACADDRLSLLSDLWKAAKVHGNELGEQQSVCVAHHAPNLKGRAAAAG